MTQRLCKSEEARLRIQAEPGTTVHALLAEITALRAELAGVTPPRITCGRSTGLCAGPLLSFNWVLDAGSRAAIDAYHQAMLAELAGAEERGRQKERARCWDIVTREAGFAEEEPEQDALLCAAACIHSEKTDEIARRRFDRTGTTPPDGGEPPA